MAIRNTHRVGDFLLQDDESGFVHYASEMRKIWDGTFRRADQFETRQPQEFVRARNDPKALRHVRPEPIDAVPNNTVSGLIGGSTVPTPQSPSGHLFKAGIGGMIIEDRTNPNTVFEVR